MQNSGNTPINGITISDTKVGGVNCPGTSLPVGGSMTCSANYMTTSGDLTSPNGIASTATASGTGVGVTVTASGGTTVGINVDAVRRATVASIRGLLVRRADMLTMMGPSKERMHHRLDGWLFGGADEDEPAPSAGGSGRSIAPAFPGDFGGTAGGIGGLRGGLGYDGRPMGLGGLPMSGPFGNGIGGIGSAGAVGTNGMPIGSGFDSARIDTGRQAAASPFGFGGAADDGAGRFSFSMSLAQVRAAALAEDDAKLAGVRDGTAVAGLTPGSLARERARKDAFDMWVEGSTAYFSADRFDGKRSGHASVLYAGADQVVMPGLLVGVMFQRDWLKETSSIIGQNSDSQGWMVGPYMSARLTRNLYLDARYARGSATNTIDPIGAYTDTFSSARELFSARLTGYWRQGSWLFRPTAEATRPQSLASPAGRGNDPPPDRGRLSGES